MPLERNPAFERKSLTQLEGRDWDPSPYVSYIQRSCYELRHKPLIEMQVEDLRLLIAHNMGLRYLMPIAFDILRQAPLARGIHYPGDLLSAVLKVEPSFYRKHSAAAIEIEAIARQALTELGMAHERFQKHAMEGLCEAVRVFMLGRGYS